MNKHVHHVSGWIALLLRFRVMEPTMQARGASILSVCQETSETTATRTPEGGRSGDTGDLEYCGSCRRYALLPVQQTVHMEKYKELSRLACVLRGVGAPRTFASRCTVTSSIGNVVGSSKTLGALNKADTYGYLWTMRAALLAEMRVEGIARLKVSPDDKVSSISAAFPDACDWASQLGRLTTTWRLSDLLKAISWKGPVELLTCILCVVLSEPRVHHLSARSVRSLQRDMIKFRSKFRKEHRSFEPHPITVLGAVGL